MLTRAEHIAGRADMSRPTSVCVLVLGGLAAAHFAGALLAQRGQHTASVRCAAASPTKALAADGMRAPGASQKPDPHLCC